MTGIPWADESWNPVTGCSKISAGCKNCYAERVAQTRLKGRCGYPADDPFRVTFHPNRLNYPLKWNKPKRIFVCSMGDLFHHDVEWPIIDQVFYACYQADWHTYLILTKRPEKAWYYFNSPIYDKPQIPRKYFLTKNIWLGVTAENQEMAEARIPILLKIPAAIRFVSVEPMLEQVRFRQWLYHTKEIDLTSGKANIRNNPYSNMLDWVICGCEKGKNRRKAELLWIQDLKNQCVNADVPFFLKQMEVDGKVKSMPGLFGIQWAEYPKIQEAV